MKFTDSLRQALINEVEGVQACYGAYFEEDGPPKVEIKTEMVGHWIWISTQADYGGATWDQSTDRLKGDPYSAHVFNNWIGEAKSAPSKVSHIVELNKWALIHTKYERQYTDVGVWGVHTGRWVDSINPDGIVTLRIQSRRRFQDVSPVLETTPEQFDLNHFRDISFEGLIQLLEDENALNREIAAKQLGALGNPQAVDPFLIQATEDDSQYVREAAIDALGKLGGDKAIEQLIHILIEKNDNRIFPMRSLVEIGEPALESLIPLLDSEDEDLSISAVHTIEDIGGVRSFEILFQASENKRPLVRARIIDALGGFGNSKAVDVLIEYLQDEDLDIQRVSAQALGKLQDKRAVEPLVISLLANNYNVRMDAAEALSLLEWKPSNPEEIAWNLFAKREWEKLVAMGDSASDTIIRALNDEDLNIRGCIIGSLSKADIAFHDPRAIKPILETYESEKGKRRDAIKALGRIRLPQVVRPLIRIYVLEEESELQKAAFETIELLSSSGVPIADTLIQMLTEKKIEKYKAEELLTYLKLFTVVPASPEQIESINPLLRNVAKQDTTKIASNLFKLNELFTKLSNGDREEREKAAELLGKTGLPAATIPLIEVLMDISPSIREKAAIALGNLGKGSLPFLLSALKCMNRSVRIGVAEALGRLRDPRAAELLLNALKDRERIVRQNAAWALGELYLIRKEYDALRGEIIHALTKAMTNDEYLPVRFNAVYSLGSLHTTQVVEPLLEALFYPEFEMRLNASYGFMQLAMFLKNTSSSIHSKVIDNLIMALSDDVDLVRYNAADSIRLNGGPKALQVLTTLLKDEDEYIREIADRGVKELKSLKGKRPSSWSYTSRNQHGSRYRYELSDPDASE